MTLNCNLAWTSDDAPSGHLSHLRHLGHLSHLGHFGHLGHLSHLSNIGDLDTLDPYSLNPAPTDSLPEAFITEMDPTDPGLSEGCYTDDLLDPLHVNTLETTYTSHVPLGDNHARQIDALNGHGPTSGIFLDALDGHGSLSEIEPQRIDSIHKQFSTRDSFV
jgi:hypothetical protein